MCYCTLCCQKRSSHVEGLIGIRVPPRYRRAAREERVHIPTTCCSELTEGNGQNETSANGSNIHVRPGLDQADHPADYQCFAKLRKASGVAETRAYCCLQARYEITCWLGGTSVIDGDESDVNTRLYAASGWSDITWTVAKEAKRLWSTSRRQ